MSNLQRVTTALALMLLVQPAWAEPHRVFLRPPTVEVRALPGEQEPVRNNLAVIEDLEVAVLNHREDWWRLKLPDGRTGWVAEEALAIDPHGGGSEYYPLAVGTGWQYGPGSPSLQRTVSGTRVRDGRIVYLVERAPEVGGLSSPKTVEILGPSEKGVLLLGYDIDVQGRTVERKLSPPRRILSFPLYLGRIWTHESELGRFSYEVAEYTTVSVQAGTFENVVKIRQILQRPGDRV